MAVSKTYIAVVILLLVLIGFVLVVIKTLANSASSRIRHDLNRVLTDYNELIEKKTEEYHSWLPKIEELNLLKKSKEDFSGSSFKQSAVASLQSAANFVGTGVMHRDKALADGYEAIKTEFRGINDNLDAVLAAAKAETVSTALGKASKNIVSAMSYASVYDLCTEEPEAQLDFFRKVLSEEDMVALNGFLETNAGEFDTVTFYDWLKANAAEEQETPSVRSGSTDTNAVFEPSICEGYQVVSGGKLYDYSISKRDIK